MSCRISGADALLVIEGDLSNEENYNSYEKDVLLIVSEYVHNVEIDLANVEKADSAIVSIILKLYKSVNVLKGSVSYINANDDIKQMLASLYISSLLS